MNSNFQKLVTSIVAQRKRLIKMQISGKNPSVCNQYIKEISIQVDAYKTKWNEEGWKAFIKRNLEKLEYLVPNNKAGETIKKKLYELK